MPPHKHSIAIKAWADGAEIEFRDPLKDPKWYPANTPCWADHQDFRVKPKQIKYRLYLYRSPYDHDDYSIRIINSHPIGDPTSDPQRELTGFIKWISEWREVEV